MQFECFSRLKVFHSRLIYTFENYNPFGLYVFFLLFSTTKMIISFSFCLCTQNNVKPLVCGALSRFKNSIRKMKTIERSNVSLDNSSKTVYGDFIALLFLSLYLLIDFLPHFNSIEIINTQFLYLSLVNIFALTFIIKNKITFFYNYPLFSRVGLIGVTYFSFLALSAFSFNFSKNLSLSINSFTQLLIIFFMIINLILLFKERLHLLSKITFLVGMSVFVQSVQQLGNFLDNFDNLTQALNNLKGNTANVNIFAASLNVKIPFLIIGILQFENWKKWFLIITLFLSGLLVFLISSRSAYLGLFFELLLFFIAYCKINSFSKKTLYQTLFIFTPIFLSIIIANIVFKQGVNIGRFESVNTRVLQIADVKEASAAARLSYWNNATKMIAKDPISGFGIGNWRIESIPYEKTTIDEALISSHTHNDFLEIAAETGIINGLVYLSLFILIFFINIKNIFTKNDTNKTISLLVLMLFTGYFVDAFFNFPLYRPTMQLAFALMILFTVLNTTKHHVVAHNSQKLGVFVMIVSVIATCITFMDWKGAQLEYKIKYDKTPVSSNVILNEFPTITKVGIYGETFYQHAAIALFNENNLDEAEKYFKLSNSVHPFLGVSNWYLHKIEKLKGNQAKAYDYVKAAFYARPRTLNFYLDGLRMAVVHKDTTEILKLHKLFSKYRSMPSNWKNTAVALKQAGYNPQKIEAFIREGVKIYPNDTTLSKKIKKEAPTSSTQNNPSETLQNIPSTINYMIEAKKMGDAKQFDKAIELYQKELVLHPEKKVIYQDIAICYFSLNKNETAVSYLLKIVNEPALNDGKTEYLLSGCYYKMQDKTNSCKYLNLAVTKKFPGSQELLKQLCQ